MELNENQPDITLQYLSIWIHGRERPDSDDYWDGNWLIATARCLAPGSTVTAQGPLIHVSELLTWQDALESMYRNLEGEANLRCMEPNLQIDLKMREIGKIEGELFITPDNLQQSHSFKLHVDQSYLPDLLCQLQKIFERFPQRGRLIES